MVNLLWSALNVLLMAGMFYILFRAAKLVKQHMGWVAMLLFLLALSILSGRTTRDVSAAPKNLLSKQSQGLVGNARSQQEIDLGGNNKLVLLAEYRITDGVVEPLGLYPTVSGIVLGHRWEPIAGSLNAAGAQVRYAVVMQHEWSLLGMTVFNQSAAFDGLMPPPAQP